MKRIKKAGGELVERGSYWNLADGRYLHFAQPDVLPGPQSATYWKVPAPLMLAIAPVLGLIYALFLPFIGLAMFAGLIAQKVVGGALEGLARAVSFGWRPSEAYFTGSDEDSKEEQQECLAEEDEAHPAEHKDGADPRDDP